jgi:hypothetical protein
MKVKIPGTVTIPFDGPIGVRDFTFDPETDEERAASPSAQQSMCAEAAAKWALQRLNAEIDRAKIEALLRLTKGQSSS